MSMPTILCWHNLKLSLTVRFIKLRSTAFFIVFLAIAKPILGLPKSLGVANSVKYRSVDFTGLEKTFLNSAAFFNLDCGGKLWPVPVTPPSALLYLLRALRSTLFGHRLMPFFHGNRGFWRV
jgi:hypothetical protein